MCLYLYLSNMNAHVHFVTHTRYPVTFIFTVTFILYWNLEVFEVSMVSSSTGSCEFENLWKRKVEEVSRPDVIVLVLNLLLSVL